ncbi:hypothetical protein [Lacihabitans soyangensis]|nr:hypothetical protein [Lacihabitans soyangensis]
MIKVKNHIIIPQKKKFKTISKGVFWAAGRALATRSFFAALPAKKGAQTMAPSLLR